MLHTILTGGFVWAFCGFMFCFFRGGLFFWWVLFGVWFFFFCALLTNLFYRNLKKKEEKKKRHSHLIWEEASVNVTNDGNTDDTLGASFDFWNM